MLRCKTSYADIATIEDVKLVGNSLVAWPTALKNCRRIPHPMRDAKPFLRDKILCRESGGHVGNVQNNLNIGSYEGKHVALFRATDTVLDCGQGTMIDFPSWKALREMLAIKIPEVALSVNMLLRLAGDAEEEVAAGLAEEVQLEEAGADGEAYGGAKRGVGMKEETPVKRPRAAKAEIDTEEWRGTEFGEYPNEIHLVTKVNSDLYRQLLQEAELATCVAYDAQWSPDFDANSSDNPIALLQLAFPITGNTYVLQLPMLAGVQYAARSFLPIQNDSTSAGWPPEVQRLFESNSVTVVGFAANEIDVHKFEISGVKIDRGTLIDVQPWCEAEMGENESVKQGWRVGLKRAAWCVIDFEMDKTSTVASSNWEREELTTAQVEYAAMDVWVALRVYQRLAPVYQKAAAS